MLNENIKNLRKAKGMSQEQLAQKLNVVRQTVSKWEKGISVPDSEMLIKLAEVLDTTVSDLLGETVTHNDKTEIQILAQKLERLNQQFAKRDESKRKIWRTVFIVVGVLALLSLLISFIFAIDAVNKTNSSIGIIGGADGPTAIFVSRGEFKEGKWIIPIIVIVISAFGIFKTRKK